MENMNVELGGVYYLRDYILDCRLIEKSVSKKVKKEELKIEDVEKANFETDNSIRDLVNWSCDQGKDLCLKLGDSLKSFHRPLLLLIYLKVYIEERVEGIIFKYKESDNLEKVEYAKNIYDKYMDLISDFYYSTKSDEIEVYSEDLKSILVEIQSMSDELGDFSLSTEVIDVFLSAFSKVNSLDLDMYSLKESSLKVRSFRRNQNRSIKMSKDDVKKTVFLLVVRLSNNWKWFQDRVKDIIGEMPDVVMREVNGEVFHKKNAEKGLDIIAKYSNDVDSFISLFSGPIGEFDSKIALNKLLSVSNLFNELSEIFTECSGFIFDLNSSEEVILDSIKRAGAIKKESVRLGTIESLKERLNNNREAYVLMTKFSRIHKIFSTHFDKLNLSLWKLIKSLVYFENVDRVSRLRLERNRKRIIKIDEPPEKNPDSTLITSDQELADNLCDNKIGSRKKIKASSRRSSKKKHKKSHSKKYNKHSSKKMKIAARVINPNMSSNAPISNPSLNTPVEIPKNPSNKKVEGSTRVGPSLTPALVPAQRLIASFTLSEVQERLFKTALRIQLEQRDKNTNYTCSLYQTQLNVCHLQELLKCAEVGFATKEQALEGALSILERSYLALEQLGKSVTIYYSDEADNRHGLLKAYSLSARDQLGTLIDGDLLKQMNHVTHWVRYPMNSLDVSRKMTTSSYGSDAKKLLTLIANCVKNEDSKEIDELLILACKLAEKSSRMLEGVVEELLGKGVFIDDTSKVVYPDKECPELVSCRKKWAEVKTKIDRLSGASGLLNSMWCDERFLQQKRSFDAILFAIDLLSRPSPATVGFASAHAAEYLVLLIRSTIEIIAKRKKIPNLDSSILSLIKNCGLPKEFYDFYENKMEGINSCCRYPFKGLDLEGDWVEVIRSGVMLTLYPELENDFSLNLQKNTQINSIYKVNKSYKCEDSRKRILLLLEESAELFLLHLLPAFGL